MRSIAKVRGAVALLCRFPTLQTEELQASRHQSAQEARGRRELDSFRAESLERMRADVEERERRLRALSEQLDRDGRMNEMQRQRSSKHIRQVWPDDNNASWRHVHAYVHRSNQPGFIGS